MRRIPFLDLRVTDAAERQELLDATAAVFDHGRLVMGPEVAELEGLVAARCGRELAVGVGSGTDALILALRCLDLGPGDEVILPAMSWIATANAVALCGATPVFADLTDELTIDPASVRALITPRTRVILPVHLYGHICDMAPLEALAAEHGLDLVEDAAQAFGAVRDGRPTGSFGRLACFSMNPMKVLAALGEAGMIVCARQDDRERLEVLRYNGTVNREVCVRPSSNGRLDTLQAALLLCRLRRVDALLARRRAIAARYNQRLAGLVVTPEPMPGELHGYYVYNIRTDRRDELLAWLQARDIEARLRDPILMPDQPAYREGVRGQFANARRLAPTLLCLPFHEGLTDDDVDYVADAVIEFFDGARR